MPLNDWSDVLDARRAADQAAPKKEDLLAMAGENADELDLEMVAVVFGFVESLRLEIRALGVTISHALGEAIDARR